MFYVTPIGQPCERHKTLPERDEPCWQCESEAACRYCGETDPNLRSVCGCYDEDACRAREHRREGAAVAFGIVGMFIEIKAREEEREIIHMQCEMARQWSGDDFDSSAIVIDPPQPVFIERTHDGRINNCALANVDAEKNCQVCHGACPDRAKYPERCDHCQQIGCGRGCLT